MVFWCYDYRRGQAVGPDDEKVSLKEEEKEKKEEEEEEEEGKRKKRGRKRRRRKGARHIARQSGSTLALQDLASSLLPVHQDVYLHTPMHLVTGPPPIAIEEICNGANYLEQISCMDAVVAAPFPEATSTLSLRYAIHSVNRKKLTKRPPGQQGRVRVTDPTFPSSRDLSPVFPVPASLRI